MFFTNSSSFTHALFKDCPLKVVLWGVLFLGCNVPALSQNTEQDLAPILEAAPSLLQVKQNKNAQLAKNYSWPLVEQIYEPLQTRFSAPAGFKRVSLKEMPAHDENIKKQLHFSRWLRNLPLRKPHTPVLSFEKEIVNANAAAVIDLDVSGKDLQQCADSILRLRAEYLFAEHRESEIKFHFTSGHLSSWKKWSQGFRPKISGSKVRFLQKAAADASRSSFRNYLENLFMYAGTSSLARYGHSIKENELRAGDYWVLAGFPGHAVLLLDVAVNEKGERRFLIGQGYMPAQSFHVVKDENDSPWLSLNSKGELHIPIWPKPFSATSLRRF